MDKIINWIWLSSANPAQMGLSAKSALLILASAITQVIGFTHIVIPGLAAALNGIIDGSVLVVTDAFMLVGAIGTVYGLVRKLILTFKGQNVAVTLPPTVAPTI